MLEVCQGDTKTIQCAKGEVIEVKKGFYGRTGLRACPVNGDVRSGQNTDCSSPQSHATVSALCNGKQSCQIGDTLAGSIKDPCYGTEKYFSVQYECGK